MMASRLRMISIEDKMAPQDSRQHPPLEDIWRKKTTKSTTRGYSGKSFWSNALFTHLVKTTPLQKLSASLTARLPPACVLSYQIHKYRLEKEIFRKWLVRIWGAITMEMGNEQTWERNPRKGEDTLDVKNVNVATDARIMEKHWENLNSYATARTDLVKLHLLLLHLQLTSSLLRMSQFLESKKLKKVMFQ